jgi:hypothetical protein
MNKTKLPKLLTILALAVGFSIVQPRLNALQDQPAEHQQRPDAASPEAQTQQAQTMTNEASEQEMFTGKIAKAGGKYVLRDSATRSVYMLDDQERAKQFEGKEVKVNGSLDRQTRTIRVSSITPGS